jgi:hypothetical protein
VSGNAIQVTQEENGNATVDFTPSTKVTEVTAAALTDVTAGSCVTVWPTKEESQAGQPITASSVRVSPAVDGKCPQGKESAPGSTGPAPSGSPTTAPAKRPAVRGAVASVAGNTINVTNTDANGSTSQTAVMVDDKTKYTKQGAATSQSITQPCGARNQGQQRYAAGQDHRPATGQRRQMRRQKHAAARPRRVIDIT